ncbi:MAG: STAS domain-containing protein [Stappiaceae bacterium]
MNIEISKEEKLCIVRPVGRIDATTSAEFEKSLSEMVELAPSKLLIDMGNVTYVASAVLSVLLGIANQLRKNANQLRLFGLSGLTQEVFEISGFISVLDIHPDEASARGEVS